MQVTPYGAAGEVTGSCYLVDSGTARVLIDCGMFQGSEKVERQNKIPAKLVEKPIDAVLLTHAHLDHCGRLPLLARNGYRGPVYTTSGSVDFMKLILEDAARIQLGDSERENRRRRRTGLSPVEPLYTVDHVRQVAGLTRAVPYNRWFDVAPGLKAQLVDAGHIIGSASVELVADQNGGRRHLVFSGDLGAPGLPFVRDPARVEYADAVFIESTYGDRDHRSLADTVSEFEEMMGLAVESRGKILVPTFAVGRAQQILYHAEEIFRRGRVRRFPIYLDSPMAIAATALYGKHGDVMDREATERRRAGQLLAPVIASESADQSRTLNEVEGPCMILAGAGMCNAGRILHHLRHNLPDPSTLVLIVGYQTRGSLGRRLVDGAPTVKVFGETVPVRAAVRGLGGFSAHAGQTHLLRWLEPMARHRPRVLLTHGEEHPRRELAYKIEELYGLDAELPAMFETLEF